MKLTKRAIDAVETPEKTTYYRFEDVTGLRLRVGPTGVKSFELYRKVKGQPKRITLGRYPAMPPELARRKAGELNADIAAGIDPTDKEADPTFGELFDDYLEGHAKKLKRSWRGDAAQYRRYLKRWANRQVSTIDYARVRKLHTRIGSERGHYAANRVLALLSKVFGYARLPNPAQGVSRFREQSRERFVTADELPQFFVAVAEEPNTTIRDYVLLSLLTGARKSNVLAMRWDELNLDGGTWRIRETKNGTPQTVPLVEQAVSILRDRGADGSPWVFPGNGRTEHMVEPKTGWKRILERAGIEDLRLHDLRRSLGSWQAATGASLSVIGKSLNHKNVTTTAIYARLEIDPVRASMETATRAMLKAGKSADVVEHRRRKGS